MRKISDGAGGPAFAAVANAPVRLRLRRAAIGIAATGWVCFCAAGLSDTVAPQNDVKDELRLEAAIAAIKGGSLRIALPVIHVVAMPSADSTYAGFKDLQELPGNDSASDQFAADVRERLPRFLASFERAGQRNGLDWRLLAAMSYQESTWDPHAVSPTGVRGIMMLTLDTAAELEVNRDNPAESIRGGAKYLGQLMQHLPRGIGEPDRTEMALAAYNQGIGHLLDARRLAAQAGGSPNRWKDVRATLPLLTDQRWFSKTRHGYARGDEAVCFVNRVRGYYVMLASITTPAGPQQIDVATTGM